MNKHKIYSAFVKVLADTITPVGAYLKMRDHYPNALLLESSDYHSKEDSFSFICLQPMAGFEASERKYSISNLDGSSYLLLGLLELFALPLPCPKVSASSGLV